MPIHSIRAITPSDVERAADALLRAGDRPTIEKVRRKIGRGSPNTITPLLDAWWSRLAGRLDAGPAALHRLPEAVAHAAEGLWLQALGEARARVAAESGSSRKALARERQDLAVQTQILSLRESELKDRIEAAERRTRQLELEIDTLTTLLRKEQATRRALEQRPGTPQAARPTRRAPARARATGKRPSRKTVAGTRAAKRRPKRRR